MHVSKRDALKVIEKIAPNISENDRLILKAFVKNARVDDKTIPSPQATRRCKK